MGLYTNRIEILGSMQLKHLSLPAILCLLLGNTLCPQDKDEKPGGATVQMVTGKAQYEDGDQVQPITKGLVLKDGQTIRTEAGALVLLKLRNGGDLIIYEKSRLQLGEKKQDPAKVKILQYEGLAWSRIPKLKAGNSFNVEMPTATAGIRGTSFSTSVDATKESQVCVCEGTVKVSSEKGEATLKQGELVKVGKEKKMGKPMGDLTFLKHPTRQTLQCLNCHQGGYTRDGRY